MLIAYYVLVIIFFVTFSLIAILYKSDGVASDALRAIMCVGLIIIAITTIVGIIGSSKTGKIYRSEYDKLIQSIEKDKTKVFKEDDEITDIYITVNGEEYHFKIKEENNNE